ncbi:hypothetical protein BGX27_006882 [Mortierella sp. AM989]|nr:hypothetical protein BGX27_006882 [Mortierella sp. AM989]
MHSLSLFEIPPIQDTLLSYLSFNETARCRRVCRLWNDVFTPYAYSTIGNIRSPKSKDFSRVFNGDSTFLAALARNRNYVRVIRVSFLDPLMSLTSIINLPLQNEKTFISFPNLRRFDWTWALQKKQDKQPLVREHQEDLALEFIARHPDLEEVKLVFHMLWLRHVTALTTILQQQHHLQKQRRSEPYQQKHHCCHHHRLRKVSVSFDVMWADYDAVRDLTAAVVEYDRSCSASCLNLQPSPQISQQFTGALITPSNSLEKVPSTKESLEEWRFDCLVSGVYHFEDIDSDEDDSSQDDEIGSEILSGSNNTVAGLSGGNDCRIKGLTTSLIQAPWGTRLFSQLLSRCPDLERLSLSISHGSSIYRRLSAILKYQCAKVKHLEFNPETFVSDEKIAAILGSCIAGLVSYTTLDPLSLRDASIEVLSRIHGRTLETLDLSNNYRWPSHYFLELVSNCSNLRFLAASLELHLYDSNDVEIGYDRLLTKSWPFHSRLKVLDLSLYRSSELEVASPYRIGDNSMTERYIDYMYTQVGSLSQLEEFRLGGWMMLLQIQTSLEKLAGLKKLKVLDLRNHTFIKWSEEEAEWICDNWTGLIEILGIKGLKTRDVVEMIKARRPWMEFN